MKAQKAVLRAKVIETEKIQVIDGNGNVLASLSVVPDKGVGLVLSDEDGRPRVILRSESLGFLDKEWIPRVMLGLDPDGNRPSLDLMGRDFGLRISLGLDSDNRPSLQLRDKDIQIRAVLGYTELVTTRTGAVEKRPPSSLVLFDKEGNIIWKAP